MQSEHDVQIANEVTRKYKRLCARRDAYSSVYGMLAKYLLARPLMFSNNMTLGQAPRLSMAGVSDDVVATMARTAATALGGALWPNISESFELVVKEMFVAVSELEFTFQTEEIKHYQEEITKRMRAAIDSPESQFQIAWGEYLDGQIVFGTSGIFGEEIPTDDINPVRFRSLSIENCVIDEGQDGSINTIFIEYALTAAQMVERYGEDAVSEKVRQQAKAESETYIKVVQALYPRAKGQVGGTKKEKPIASIHVDMDCNEVLREDGMDELPGWVGRFRKYTNEVLGRSLAMDAFASIKELNAMRHSYTHYLALSLKPPIGFWSDMFGGAGQIDLSMDAKNQLYATGQIPQGTTPVVNLMPVQEPQAAVMRMKELTESISSKFLVDRLLDFNNKTRMTLGEAEMRSDYRNQALGNIFSRQIIEVLQPLVTWVFKVMLRRGLLGLDPELDRVEIFMRQAMGEQVLVIPGPIAEMIRNGRMPFTVRFVSPAARAMQAEALQGLNQMTNYAFSWVNAGYPEITDNFDLDKAMRFMQTVSGGPRSVLRGQDQVDQIRRARDQARKAQGDAAMAEQQSTVQKNQAKAARDFAQAGVVPGLGGMSA